MHFEAKKSQDEKEILAKKYEDTIKSLNEAHSSRLKTLSSQHQLATETLIDQFTKEINMLKCSQKAHIDRLIQENESKQEYFQKKIEDLQATHKHKMSKHASDHQKSLKNLNEALKKDHEAEIIKLRDSFEQEKQELIKKSSQDLDSQLKMIINKLYEETRKEWKAQESKLNDEIRSLRFQLENQRLKNKAQEDIVRKSNFFESLNEDRVKSVWSVERGENFSIWTDKDKCEIGLQVGCEWKSVAVETEIETGMVDRVNEVREEFNAIFEKVFEKVVSITNSKNKAITHLESRLSSLLIKNSELCALIKSLNSQLNPTV